MPRHMPTHRSWSRKANKHLKQIFRTETNQDRLRAIKEYCDRIATDYEEQYAKATDPARQDKYNRESGANHDYTVRTVGPARTCEAPPDLLDTEPSTPIICEPSILDKEINEEQLFEIIWPALL